MPWALDQESNPTFTKITPLESLTENLVTTKLSLKVRQLQEKRKALAGMQRSVLTEEGILKHKNKRF